MGKKGSILLLVILIAVVMFISGCTESNIIRNESLQDDNKPECRMVQVPKEVTETYMETVQYTEHVCEFKELSFKDSRDNMVIQRDCIADHEECIKYVVGICTSKKTVCDEYRLYCEYEITNLDSERGIWSVSWTHNCELPSCKVISSINYMPEGYSQMIDPTESRRVLSYLNYDSEEYPYCSPRITYIPTKEVCRDELRYKEIPKTRTTTRYIEEEVCD